MTTLTKSRIKAGITQAATMLLTVLAWVTAHGSNPLPGLVPERTWQAVTLVAALAIGVWNGWKNQNWTGAAVAAQSLLDHIKAGADTEDQPGTTWYATEAMKNPETPVDVAKLEADRAEDEAVASKLGDVASDVTPATTDVTPAMTSETLPTGATAGAAA